jgi:hypothetical protein
MEQRRGGVTGTRQAVRITVEDWVIFGAVKLEVDVPEVDVESPSTVKRRSPVSVFTII